MIQLKQGVAYANILVSDDENCIRMFYTTREKSEAHSTNNVPPSRLR